jgi:hypothetical protein
MRQGLEMGDGTKKKMEYQVRQWRLLQNNVLVFTPLHLPSPNGNGGTPGAEDIVPFTFFNNIETFGSCIQLHR